MGNKNKIDAIAKASGLDPKSLEAMICISTDGDNIVTIVSGDAMYLSQMLFQVAIENDDIQLVFAMFLHHLYERKKNTGESIFNPNITGEA